MWSWCSTCRPSGAWRRRATRLLEAEKTAHAEATAARERERAVSRQEAAARLRLKALETVAAGLATAMTSEQIADVLVERGMPLIADQGAVTLLDPAGGHLLTRVTSTFPAAIARIYARVPLAQAGELPVGQVALSGRSVMMTSAEESPAASPWSRLVMP